MFLGSKLRVQEISTSVERTIAHRNQTTWRLLFNVSYFPNILLPGALYMQFHYIYTRRCSLCIFIRGVYYDTFTQTMRAFLIFLSFRIRNSNL